MPPCASATGTKSRRCRSPPTTCRTCRRCGTTARPWRPWPRAAWTTRRSIHEALVPATKDPVIEKMLAWDRYSLIGGVQVAERFVAAAIARSEKKYDEAIAALNTAVTIEDTLPYDEPPAWNWPSRLALGNVLLEAKQAGRGRAGVPRRARAQSRERLVPQWPREGAEGAGQERGGEGSRTTASPGPGRTPTSSWTRRGASPPAASAARSAASASRACGAEK